MHIYELETALAIPNWEGEVPPLIQLALLSDWGMAAPLPNSAFRPKKSVLQGDDNILYC